MYPLTSKAQRIAQLRSREVPEEGAPVLSCPTLSQSLTMIVAAFLSAIHVRTVAVGLGSVFARDRALARRLDDEGWKRFDVRQRPRRRVVLGCCVGERVEEAHTRPGHVLRVSGHQREAVDFSRRSK